MKCLNYILEKAKCRHKRRINPTVSAGLDCLKDLNQIIISQEPEFIEMVTKLIADSVEYFWKYEEANMYVITDTEHNLLLNVVEVSNPVVRSVCPTTRRLTLNVCDTTGEELLSFERKSSIWPIPSFLAFGRFQQKMLVYNTDKQCIGSVVQVYNSVSAVLSIHDPNGKELLIISNGGSMPAALRNSGVNCLAKFVKCFLCWFVANVSGINSAEISYHIKKSRAEKDHIGIITRRTQPILVACVRSDADTFDLSFPPDADVNTKILIVAACFLIDYMCYET